MDAFDGVTPVLDLDYGYDLAGNITDIDDIGGGSRGRNYAYDPLHRLTQGQELVPGAATVALQTDYTYDAVGNRTTRNVGGAAETYSYDPASNRLASVLAGGVTRAFTYSATGNVTLDDRGGSAMVLTYNAADRLVKVSAGPVTLVEYVYSATGQRASKTTTTGTTHYLYDPGGALYAETDGAGTVLREYITLGGATIAIVDAGGMAFMHNDHLATPQVMTDGAAAVVWDASYRPFGEAVIAGAVANEQRFPGQTADATTGYHDNWFRTYDPSLGRYLQSDPIGLQGGWNTYGYAGGNPVMYADPTGLKSSLGPAALIGAVAVRVGRVAATMGRSPLVRRWVRRVWGLAKNTRNCPRERPELPGPPNLPDGGGGSAGGGGPGGVPGGGGPGGVGPDDVGPDVSGTTRNGIKRTNPADWRKLRDRWDDGGYGDILSADNRGRIAKGKTPIVDDAWVEYFPGDAGLVGEKINMHHIGGNGITIPLPYSRHRDAHMPGGYKNNPGGPGMSG